MSKLKLIGVALTFGAAMEVLKNGGLVQRSTWDNGSFVFRQIPSTVSKDIVPKMQSVPDKAKKVFEKRFEDPKEETDSISYHNQLAFVNKSNLVSGYAPTPEEALADDWFEVEAED